MKDSVPLLRKAPVMSSARNLWSLAHAERAALIDDLDRVSERAWSQPSLCKGWTVADVTAHLIDNARTTRAGFMGRLVRARFDFDRANAVGVQREGERSPQQMLHRLRQVAPRTSTPPASLDTRLVEEIVHGEDIRRPLGITRRYPIEALTRALQVQARTPASFGGAKELITQVHLTAVDGPVSLGHGQVVTGPALSLLLAVCGRRAALDDLEGPGITALAAAV